MNTIIRTIDAAIVLYSHVNWSWLNNNVVSVYGGTTYRAPKEKMARIPIFRATVRCKAKICIY